MDIIEFLTRESIALIAVFTPIILAAVEVVKRFITNTRYAPLFAIFFGVLLGIFFSGLTLPYGILLGILSGLGAAGLYSSAKTVAGK